jgi:hypothetical protein
MDPRLARKVAAVTGGMGGIVVALTRREFDAGDLPFTTGVAVQVDGEMLIRQY